MWFGRKRKYKVCEREHYYDPALSKCPVCEEEARRKSLGTLLKRTKVFDSGESCDHADADPFTNENRRVVGWVISFTLASSGRDFRLYEGENRIGRDARCEIQLPGNPKISPVHLVIIYRNGYFSFRDENSDQGTFINGRRMESGVLHDRDEIIIGNQIFRFRTVF